MVIRDRFVMRLNSVRSQSNARNRACKGVMVMSNILQYSPKNVAFNTTNYVRRGVVAAIVLPFRVAQTTPMIKKIKKRIQNYKITEPPGVNIFRLRNERGWSQRKLADACNPPLEHTTIRRIENNQGYTQDSLERIARALNIDVYALFLPSGLIGYTRLPDDSRQRISAIVEDAVTAYQVKKQKP
jgi:transcriptional regulator with XRE-family HTH domain